VLVLKRISNNEIHKDTVLKGWPFLLAIKSTNRKIEQL
jgi:hypothetical protein